MLGNVLDDVSADASEVSQVFASQAPLGISKLESQSQGSAFLFYTRYMWP